MAMVMQASWAAGKDRIKTLPQRLMVRRMENEGWWGMYVEVWPCGRVDAFMTNDSPDGTRRDAATMKVCEDGSVEVVG